MSAAPIRIEFFGSFRVLHGERIITRFPTQKAASLLAYLAFYAEPHPREALIEMLWPDGEIESGRASLSQALSMLRRQLEPPGTPAGSVIVGTKTHAGINSAAIDSDVADFARALRRARQGSSRIERRQSLQDAIDLYGGEFLPGFYEDWALNEQRRLSTLYFQAAESLIQQLEKSGDLDEAIEYARKAVAVEPTREEMHGEVMRLCAAAGRPEDALEQYRELERILERELGDQPSQAIRRMARKIEEQAATRSPSVKVKEPRLHDPHPSTLNPQLPRGTVSFLFTDIEGSTALWESAGESFQRALETHHKLLRQCFESFGGHEVKEAGDSFLIAFERPTDAIACAIACQREVDSLSLIVDSGTPADDQPSTINYQLRVRMSLHTGEVQLEEGEYRGITLHRASRILTAAHGGQILCSESTAGLVRRDLPAGMRLVDLGVYRLRDVPSPERIFQVNYDGMNETDFPPLNAEAGYQSNLPLQFTRFFGREEQLAQLSEMLQAGDTRLVTITGPGGTGKTRLALEVANRLLEPFAGAVWFVPLVDLSDPKLIAGAIVDSLRIPRSPTADPLDQAVEALNRQPSLLILDNLEQFVEEGGQVVRALLERVPLLTFLVTSRQSLSLSPEREYQLAPLATPNGPGTPERLTMFESVRLFVDRAQAVKSDFQVTNQNAPAVAELCDRLEGIPLAIELAAARASVLSPSHMLLQLEHRFDFLVSRRRDTTAHHGTLRAAMDWSYDLLSPEIQRFFARLSVFRGGWTVEAAEAVCEEPLALDHLALLRDCSLILAEEGAEGMRFRILVTLREYAEERLSLDERAAARTGHLDFFLHLAEEGEPHLTGPEQAVWLERLAVEHDNFRAALVFASTSMAGTPNNEHPTPNAEFGLRLAGALWRFWMTRGHLSDRRAWLGSALSRLEAHAMTAARAQALYGAGVLAHCQGDYAAARALYEESLAIQRELGDRRGIAKSLGQLGFIAELQGDYPAARVLVEECLAISRELGDKQVIGASLCGLGSVAKAQGNYPAGRALYGESLAIMREIGDRSGIASLLNNLGTVAYEQGDYPAARPLHEESLAIRREIGNRQGTSESLINLGALAADQGNYDMAWALYAESLSIARDIGARYHIAYLLASFASLAAARQQPQRGAQLWGAAESLREAIDSPLPPYEQEKHDRDVTAARAEMGEEAFAAAWAAGRDMTEDEAVEYALQESV